MVIQKSIQDLILRGRVSIGELADGMGISENMVYRLGMPEGALEKAVRRVLALMIAQKDFSLLKALCGRTGHLLVKVPRVARNRQEDSEMVAHYQETVTDAVSLMLDYVRERTPASRDALLAALDDVSCESVGISKRVKNDQQMELEL